MSTETPSVGGQSPHAEIDPHYARRWMVLAVIGLAQLMVVLDATVVNIALPSAQHALSFSNNDRQWIVTGYALSFGSLLLLGGRLADLIGRKRTFIIGLVGFAIASAIGGASVNFQMLVGARIVQGAFGALLAPTALSLLSTTFVDPGERGKAFGVYGAIAGAGGAIGLLLGGFLTEYLSWRWSLYVNLIFAVAAVIGGIAFLHNADHATKPKLDLPGVLTVTGAMFSFVYGFSHATTSGWANGITLAFLAAGVVLLTGFILIERRTGSPLLPLRVILDRNRGGALLAIFGSAMGMFAIFLFLTYYLQSTLNYSPIVTGLAFLPMIVFLVLSATISTAKLLPRYGARPLAPTGLVIAAVGLFLLSKLGVHASYSADILPALVLMGLGLGLVFAPAMNTATAGVIPSDAGVASATVNATQQIGGSIGTALLNTLATSAGVAYLVGRAPTKLAIAQATVHSYTTAFSWASAIFVLTAVVVAVVLKSGAPEAAGEMEPAFL